MADYVVQYLAGTGDPIFVYPHTYADPTQFVIQVDGVDAQWTLLAPNLVRILSNIPSPESVVSLSNTTAGQTGGGDWGGDGGGTPGPGSGVTVDGPLLYLDRVIEGTHNIPPEKNALAINPIVAPGASVNVPAGSTYAIIGLGEGGEGGGGGTTDHGTLGGLEDDDHPQYLNPARGDARYYTQAYLDEVFESIPESLNDLAGVAPTESEDGYTLTWDHVAATWVLSPPPTGGSGTSDHGELAGLGDDDHPQYLNTARGDARYYLKSQVDTALAGKAAAGHTHPYVATGGAVVTGVYGHSVQDLGSRSGTQTVVPTSNNILVTLSGNWVPTFSPAAGLSSTSFVLVLTNASAYSVTWQANIVWSEGTPPDLSTPTRHIVALFYVETMGLFVGFHSRAA